MSNVRQMRPDYRRYASSLTKDLPDHIARMAEALNRPCPKPITDLPETKHFFYRESVRRGGLYVQELFAMGRAYEEKHAIAVDINAITARHLRSVARCNLITRFWRSLGAA